MHETVIFILWRLESAHPSCCEVMCALLSHSQSQGTTQQHEDTGSEGVKWIYLGNELLRVQVRETMTANFGFQLGREAWGWGLHRSCPSVKKIPQAKRSDQLMLVNPAS